MDITGVAMGVIQTYKQCCYYFIKVGDDLHKKVIKTPEHWHVK